MIQVTFTRNTTILTFWVFALFLVEPPFLAIFLYGLSKHSGRTFVSKECKLKLVRESTSRDSATTLLMTGTLTASAGADASTWKTDNASELDMVSGMLYSLIGSKAPATFSVGAWVTAGAAGSVATGACLSPPTSRSPTMCTSSAALS